MKRVLTIILVSVLVLVVTALVVSLVTLRSFRFFLPNFAPVRTVDRTYESQTDPIDALMITVRNRAVKVQLGQGSSVLLDWNEAEIEPLTVTESNGRLVIDSEENTSWQARLGWLQGLSLRPLVVTLPAAFQGQIDLVTSNGPVSLEDLNVTGPINIRTSNGAISAQNVITQDNVIWTSSNGPIEVKQIRAKSINFTTSNGRITASNILAESMDLHTSNGPINCSQISGNSIYLETSNGKISGTIQGQAADYTIRSDTSNGSNSLENLDGQGDRNLNVKTSNGDIDLEFSGMSQTAGGFRVSALPKPL